MRVDTNFSGVCNLARGAADFPNADASRILDIFSSDHPFKWDQRQGAPGLSGPVKRLLGLAPDATPDLAAIMALIEPDDLDRVKASWSRAAETDGTLRLVLRVRRPGLQSPYWLSIHGQWLRDFDGAVFGAEGVMTDFSRWQISAQASLAREPLGLRAAFDKVLLDSLPQMVWSATADGVTDFYNNRWYEFTGVPVGTTDGPAWSNVLHPEDAPAAAAHWQSCVQAGIFYEIEYRVRTHDGRYAWVLARGVPKRDDQGNILRWYGTCTDIDDRKIAESRRDLIAEELAHRIKNIFTVVNSLIALSTDRDTGTLESDALSGRIAALASAYRHVMPDNADILAASAGTLHGLMQDLLGAYSQKGETRISLDGDDYPISRGAATALALLFHELATNAVKYGSLGQSRGHVAIGIKDDNDRVEMIWHESGVGGVVDPGNINGFGTDLADRIARIHLGATIERTWHQDGLVVRVSMLTAKLQT